ncbi:MAG TPA: hypothetical protein VI876_12190, partial [Dehalococcoidia bacterium]|nr:hypothetical protein [Dehalococcoidia bacterium]
STLTLASSEPEYYGRVSSLQQINGSLGSFLLVPVGLLVDGVGAPSVIVVSGLLILSFWCFVALFVGSYRRIEMPPAGGGRTTAEEQASPAAT